MNIAPASVSPAPAAASGTTAAAGVVSAGGAPGGSSFATLLAAAADMQSVTLETAPLPGQTEVQSMVATAAEAGEAPSACIPEAGVCSGKPAVCDRLHSAVSTPASAKDAFAGQRDVSSGTLLNGAAKDAPATSDAPTVVISSEAATPAAPADEAAPSADPESVAPGEAEAAPPADPLSQGAAAEKQEPAPTTNLAEKAERKTLPGDRTAIRRTEKSAAGHAAALQETASTPSSVTPQEAVALSAAPTPVLRAATDVKEPEMNRPSGFSRTAIGKAAISPGDSAGMRTAPVDAKVPGPDFSQAGQPQPEAAVGSAASPHDSKLLPAGEGAARVSRAMGGETADAGPQATTSFAEVIARTATPEGAIAEPSATFTPSLTAAAVQPLAVPSATSRHPLQAIAAHRDIAQAQPSAPAVRRLEVALDDPLLGRLDVKAELRAGNVHTTIAGTAEIAAAGPALHQFLRQQEVSVHSVHFEPVQVDAVRAPAAAQGSASSGQFTGAGAGGTAQQFSSQQQPSSQSGDTRGQRSAAAAPSQSSPSSVPSFVGKAALLPVLTGDSGSTLSIHI